MAFLVVVIHYSFWNIGNLLWEEHTHLELGFEPWYPGTLNPSKTHRQQIRVWRPTKRPSSVLFPLSPPFLVGWLVCVVGAFSSQSLSFSCASQYPNSLAFFQSRGIALSLAGSFFWIVFWGAEAIPSATSLWFSGVVFLGTRCGGGGGGDRGGERGGWGASVILEARKYGEAWADGAGSQ